MFSTLRTRFGIPGVISVMALVFAMFGGAYAASNSSDGGKATASAKAKQGPRGKTGKTGPAGPAGPAGPTGPAGAQGAAGPKGDAGANGTSGTTGTAGQSVNSSTENPGTANCFGRGGSKFVTGATTTYACNGATGSVGPQGPQGEPWIPDGQLPVGASETGIWGTGEGSAAGVYYFPISFPIPVDNNVNSNLVTTDALVTAEEEKTTVPHCPGIDSQGLPMAESGQFCLYIGPEVGVSSIKLVRYVYEKDFAEFGALGTAGSAGTLVKVQCSASCFVNGYWAVTG